MLMSSPTLSNVNSTDRINFSIDQQRTDLALIELAEQANITLVFSFDDTATTVANEVYGYKTVSEAAAQLLANTGLSSSVNEQGNLQVFVMSESEITMNKKPISEKLGLFFSSIFLATSAAASEGEQQPAQARGPALEEVIVTAQKRAESLQDVPISIQAFSGDNLDELGIQSSEEILKMIPNANSISAGGSKQNLYIRGVGTADFHLNVVGAIGAYLDDVALNSPFAVSFSTFDMERVEVLRGPQNTLFGRNTTGGALNYISRKPSVEEGTNGYIKAGWGRYDQIDLEAGIGFALGENAAARVSAVSNTRDGVLDNVTLGTDVGDRDKQAVRGQILWQPSDDGELLLRVHAGQTESSPMPYKNVGFQDPNNTAAPCPVTADDRIPTNNPNCVDSSGFNHQYSGWEDVYGNLEHREDVDIWGTSLKVSWDFDSITLTSVTAYDSTEVVYAEDADGAPTTIFQLYQEGDYDQYSQELRLQSDAEGDYRWIAGFYYFLEEAQYSTAVRRTPDPFAPSGPGYFNIIPNTQVEQDNEVYSLFGQLEYDFRSDVTGTVGLRWTNESKDGSNAPSVRCVGPIGGPPFCPALDDDVFIGPDVIDGLPALASPPVEALDETWKEWGARFALDWRVTDDALLFTSISRGFKGGGFSVAALQALTGNAAQSVDPEILWAYEIGLKSSWLDNSLQVNVSAFYYDWEDLQSFQVLNDPATGIGVPQLVNVPESSLIGSEIEVQWVPADGWFIMAGLGFLDGEIDDPGLIAGVSKGNTLPNTPDLSFNALVRKELNVGDGTLALQANWSYKDVETYDLLNAPNLSLQDSVTRLNARVAYRFGAGERYEISAWGENLTEEEDYHGATSLAGLAESNLYLPSLSEATYGVKLAVLFD